VVADEPLVGLDRDRPVGIVATVEQRRPQPLLVAALGDLADELVDQVAAVGEDQDAAGARGVDEADRGDRLAGAGRVLEPEAPLGTRVLGRLLDRLVLVVGRPLLPVPRLLVGGELLLVLLVEGGLAVGGDDLLDRGAVLGGGLLLGDQLGQRAGERVDLVRVQLRPVAQLRRLLGEQPLQPEQQLEVAPPLDRGVLRPFVELLQGAVEGAAPCRARRQRLRPLAVEQEGLTGELRRPLDVVTRWNCRPRGNFGGLGHEGFRVSYPPHSTRGRGHWCEDAGSRMRFPWRSQRFTSQTRTVRRVL
jgi:hypothetical protein